MDHLSELDRLIKLLGRLPGLGPRSARRAVLKMINQPDRLMRPLADALTRTADALRPCGICGNISTADPCRICADPSRSDSVLCVVEDVADLWALERAGTFTGRYHVLGGTLSALNGVGPDDLRITQLTDRIARGGISEIILATNATVEGQTTAHYIAGRLQETGAAVSRLAHGVPMGAELDYLDEGTLATALKARRMT